MDLTQLAKDSRFAVAGNAVTASSFKPAAGVPAGSTALATLGDVRIERKAAPQGKAPTGPGLVVQTQSLFLDARRERMSTLRQQGGLSGFPRREESVYDAFGTAHSSTSISAALGMAMAAKRKGESRRAVAIIGDGAMTAGMAFEALNNAGVEECKLLVILNDNDMSISPPVGALNKYLARLMSGMGVLSMRKRGPFPLRPKVCVSAKSARFARCHSAVFTLALLTIQ